ncbi:MULTISPECIES: hypothetical protein [Sinorhizobium]|uniref:hypothetical protein n=1 Tax=Sinorhizobium TaxID=28105 RepID=UPI000BE7DF1D|nr:MULTISPECIES: hypothetical protein [Sinorhizobium]PDT55134.1 hypothetical protein CO664_08775 [Sinorhizobium sp. NG07B]POH32175.1 hypothetical protein ATY30_12370 [Sinorhizobium americanum]
MDWVSQIKAITDEELLEYCVLAVGVCASDEAMDPSLPDYWNEILKEVFVRGWAGTKETVIRDTLRELESLRDERVLH